MSAIGSLAQYILIHPEDAPTISELKNTILRLRKDAEILKDFSRKKENPKDFLAIAKFLESLLERERNRLRKGQDETPGDNSGS